MQIFITGNVDTGTALKNYVDKRLKREVKKYFDSAISSHVFFKKQNQKQDGNFPIYHVNIVINEGSKRNVVIKSDAESNDTHIAFDLALDKIAKQLRRYKKRLQDFTKKNGDKVFVNQLYANKYVLPYKEEDSWSESKREEEQEELNIITEKETEIENLSVNEAIMKMDLAYLPALMFTNKDSGRLNVVYHRKDGNISWVDPKI